MLFEMKMVKYCPNNANFARFTHFQGIKKLK